MGAHPLLGGEKPWERGCRIVEPDFEGVNFAAALFGKRLDKVFQETAVDSETSFQIQCVKDIRCLSYNLGTTNEKGNFTCQLCDSDRFTSHENLTQDEKWLYRGMEVLNRRSRKKLYLFLLPCNSFGANSKKALGSGSFFLSMGIQIVFLLHVTREFYSIKFICRNLYAIFFTCEKSLYSQSEWRTAVFHMWKYNQSTI